MDRIDASSYAPLDRGHDCAVDAESARRSHCREGPGGELPRGRARALRTGCRRTSWSARRSELPGQRSTSSARASPGHGADRLGSFQVLGGDWRAEEPVLRAASAARHRTTCCAWRASTWRPEQHDGRRDVARAGERDRSGRRTSIDAGRGARRREQTSGATRVARNALAPARTSTAIAMANGGAAPRAAAPLGSRRGGPRRVHGRNPRGRRDHRGHRQLPVSDVVAGNPSHSTADFAAQRKTWPPTSTGSRAATAWGTLECPVEASSIRPSTCFAEVLLEPAFDVAELERERSETLAALANAAKTASPSSPSCSSSPTTHFREPPLPARHTGGHAGESVELFRRGAAAALTTRAR